MKHKYYIHNIISLVIFCISCILNDLILGNYTNTFSSLKAFYIFIFILADSLNSIYIKYLMDSKFKQYWNILFSLGLFGFIWAIIVFIYSIVFQKIQGEIKIIDDLFSYFTEVEIWNIFLKFFINFFFIGMFRQIVKIILLKNLTPNHLLVGQVLRMLLLDFKFIDKEYKLYGNIIIFIVKIFSLLFYIEILECNFCGLNRNTKRNIQLRAFLEDNIRGIVDEDDRDDLEISPGYIIEKEQLKINNIMIEMEEKNKENSV